MVSDENYNILCSTTQTFLECQLPVKKLDKFSFTPIQLGCDNTLLTVVITSSDLLKQFLNYYYWSCFATFMLR